MRSVLTKNTIFFLQFPHTFANGNTIHTFASTTSANGSAIFFFLSICFEQFVHIEHTILRNYFRLNAGRFWYARRWQCSNCRNALKNWREKIKKCKMTIHALHFTQEAAEEKKVQVCNNSRSRQAIQIYARNTQWANSIAAKCRVRNGIEMANIVRIAYKRISP